ncbi:MULTISPECIES: hypothetical protein [unclassified Agarivorans]|uniref:hypothetical protein n=1 Tax=unclassified Agarivorans TaxID=2636026 RepID=UPI0026E37A70|nr:MULTISPECIES: hypothetical protein [unclassified Agarivorans]MDO6687253.1 hypothetical protein [Agarivorans sp. 3_MG-2023]MDO6716820.1 hypothetical protein [Agarivorans sp. 2_MG-2023]
MTRQFCQQCEKVTEHKEIVKQKPSKYGSSKMEQFKAFLEGFFGGTASAVGASLDLVDRYVECEKCQLRTLENHGEEFQ